MSNMTANTILQDHLCYLFNYETTPAGPFNNILTSLMRLSSNTVDHK